jgi:hypothetical protein
VAAEPIGVLHHPPALRPAAAPGQETPVLRRVRLDPQRARLLIRGRVDGGSGVSGLVRVNTDQDHGSSFLTDGRQGVHGRHADFRNRCRDTPLLSQTVAGHRVGGTPRASQPRGAAGTSRAIQPGVLRKRYERPTRPRSATANTSREPHCLGRRPSGAGAPGAVVPLRHDEPAMPGQQGPGSNREDLVPAATMYQAGEYSQPESVRWLVTDRAGELTAQQTRLRATGPVPGHHEQPGAQRLVSPFPQPPRRRVPPRPADQHQPPGHHERPQLPP